MMKKFFNILFAVFMLLVWGANAYSEDAAADSEPVLQIVGRVKTPVTLTRADLLKMEQVSLKEFIEFGSHSGYHGEYPLKGVSFKKLLEEVAGGVDAKGPEKLVFVFVSKDGYYAGFTYGELYDTFTEGAGILIGTEADGKPLDTEYHGNFRSFVTTDKYAGRAVKWLEKIVVKYMMDDPEFDCAGAKGDAKQ